MFHNCNIANEEERHQFCPRFCTSWCMWWSDKLTLGQNKGIKKLFLSLTIKSLLMPVFRDLSNETLLEKCLYGYTENDNEAINSVIWKKCPKDVFVSKKVLEIAAALATSEFNDGSNG